MNLRRSRSRRPDEWPSSHARARADLAEQLDGALDPGESAWLVGHLSSCDACRDVDEEYATQRLELRALRDRTPQPPRDLWARTAARIENESRFRDGSARRAGGRRLLAPSAVLATALVVAVAIGTLTSSQRPGGGGTAGIPQTAHASSAPSVITAAGPTPIPVTEEIEYLVKDKSGTFTIRKSKIDEVCPSDSTEPCDTTAPTEEHPVDLDQDTSTVFGSHDSIVTYSYADDGTLSVTTLRTPAPAATPTPTPRDVASPTPTPTTLASALVQPSQAPQSASPSATPSKTPASPTVEPTASVEVTPAPDGSIEIASDVALVGQSAAYSKTGSWFAFTARPIDGSAGPDVYVWKVGDAKAHRVTDDHRSMFGSWAGDLVAGSTVVEKNPNRLDPATFLLDPTTSAVTGLAQIGQAWRPSVDPTGRKAVYWSGTVRATSEPGYAPDAGRLVLGDWGVTAVRDDSASPAPTAPHGDQSAVRHETTISAGRIGDWDARWDTDGTHLAVWIADTGNPAVGRLSLYAVDAFDGKIDLKTPLLDSAAAAAGYAISDGKLVWADPTTASSDTGKIQLLAWSDKGVGTVETITGPAIVIR